MSGVHRLSYSLQNLGGSCDQLKEAAEVWKRKYRKDSEEMITVAIEKQRELYRKPAGLYSNHALSNSTPSVFISSSNRGVVNALCNIITLDFTCPHPTQCKHGSLNVMLAKRFPEEMSRVDWKCLCQCLWSVLPPGNAESSVSSVVYHPHMNLM